MNTTAQPSQRFVFVRNPFYHRVDANGRQLPYIDRVVMALTDPKLVPLKTASGESDLQSRGLNFSDITFLKENEERNDYSLRLWSTVRGSELAIYPNLNASDPVWRELLRDVRFRRALSLAIDRERTAEELGFAAVHNNVIAVANSRGETVAGNQVIEINGLVKGVGQTGTLANKGAQAVTTY